MAVTTVCTQIDIAKTHEKCGSTQNGKWFVCSATAVQHSLNTIRSRLSIAEALVVFNLIEKSPSNWDCVLRLCLKSLFPHWITWCDVYQNVSRIFALLRTICRRWRNLNKSKNTLANWIKDQLNCDSKRRNSSSVQILPWVRPFIHI